MLAIDSRLPGVMPVSRVSKAAVSRSANLDMSYGDLDVLKQVTLAVEPGTVTCIIGPSGSGKSTLLRCINRLVEPKGGDVRIDGESILAMKPEKLRRRVGMVFQHFNLFPDHTALENVMLALTEIKGLPNEEAERIAQARLADVGLAARSHHRPKPSFRRTTATGGDRPGSGHGSGGYPLR